MFGKVLAKLRKGDPAPKIRAAATEAYRIEKAAKPGTVLEPAAAKKAIREKVGRPVEGIVDPVYFELRGRDNPLSLPAKPNARSVAVAVRKRRDGGGPLGRWESVAAAASEALGRPVSVSTAKALYAKGGGDLATSYVGRGTRVGAPGTLGDLSEEIPS